MDPGPEIYERYKTFPPIIKAEIRLQFGLTTALAILATILVLGRLSTRRFYIGKVELDDWMLLVAWIFLMGFAGAQLASVPVTYVLSDHLEVHIWEPRVITAKLKFDYALVIIYYICVYLTKLSILCLYLRLCRSETKLRYTSSGGRLRGLTWLTIILITLMFVPCVLVAIFRCIPPANVWSVTGNATDNGCIHRPSFFIATSVLHIVADIIIAILPIPLVMKIRGPLMYRVGLIGVLMLGLLATAACIGRLVVLIEANRQGEYFYKYATMVNTWSFSECALGIIGASIPALKPIFRKVCQILGASGWSTANCTSPQDHSGQSESLPYRIAVEGNKRRINDLHLAEAGEKEDGSKCSKSDSRTNSSRSGSAQTQTIPTARPSVTVPLAAKLRVSGCNTTG
ncbi:hypothetical protein TWF281_008621 [Arthrobotrys megalospora]